MSTSRRQQPGDPAAGSSTDSDTGPMTVLVIDDDAERRETARVILEFIDAGPVRLSDCEHWRESVGDSATVLAAIVGACDASEDLAGLVQGLRNTDVDLPVLLMSEPEAKPVLDNALGAEVLSQVPVPIRYEQLTDALNKARIFRESRRNNPSRRPVTLFRSLVGNSPQIQHVRTLMEQVSGSDANVLILGESGTGKEVVARNLHYHSPRREHPFVPINCGAVPPDLLESELFGHEKGSFTGAVTARQGRFEMAEGGTLFLDEIGDMPLAMQVKLLRVLQERTYERVGSNKSIKADVRIIAATHRDLEVAIEEGKFREDLYYRLNVFPIDMPPLRERVSDIPLLVNELIARFEFEKRGSVRLTPAAAGALCHYAWPGNVRELANLIERLVILFPYGVVDIHELPDKYRPEDIELPDTPAVDELLMVPSPASHPRLPIEGMDLKEFMGEMECTYIRQALEQAEGVVAHAAKLLKMRRTTLVEKMRKYGLPSGKGVASP